MPRYRLLHLDPFSGHIDSVERFHASDDVEAICRVQNRKRAHPAELWNPAGKVSRFDSLPEIGPSSMIPAPSREPTPVLEAQTGDVPPEPLSSWQRLESHFAA